MSGLNPEENHWRSRSGVLGSTVATLGKSCDVTLFLQCSCRRYPRLSRRGLSTAAPTIVADETAWNDDAGALSPGAVLTLLNVFDAFDLNHDGYWSLAELNRFQVPFLTCAMLSIAGFKQRCGHRCCVGSHVLTALVKMMPSPVVCVLFRVCDVCCGWALAAMFR